MAADLPIGRPAARPAGTPAASHPAIARSGTAPGRRPGARTWVWTTVTLTGCALAGAAVLAPPAAAAPGRGLAALLFLGSSVHVAATGWLYTLPGVRAQAFRRPRRYLCLPAGLILAGAVTAAVLSPAAVTWLLLALFAWQVFHFQKQNVGMVALAASAFQVKPLRPAERRALTGAGAAGIIALTAQPGLLQLALRPGAGQLSGLAGALFAISTGTGLLAISRRARAGRPAGFCAMYLMALLFPLPIFVFRSPYAAVGGMTIAHGFQYLLLVGLLAAGSRQGTGRSRRIWIFCNVALAGGALLSVASHLHGSPPAIRLLFGAYLGTLMAHFVIDAGLWRMRDPAARGFLAGSLPWLVSASPGSTRAE